MIFFFSFVHLTFSLKGLLVYIENILHIFRYFASLFVELLLILVSIFFLTEINDKSSLNTHIIVPYWLKYFFFKLRTFRLFLCNSPHICYVSVGSIIKILYNETTDLCIWTFNFSNSKIVFKKRENVSNTFDYVLWIIGWGHCCWFRRKEKSRPTS